MGKTFQKEIFDQILIRYSKKSEIIEELSSVLEVSKDAVYRRLRGTTILSPTEMATLAQHYKISLDTLVFGQEETVFFNFSSFSQPISNIGDYLESVGNNLDHVKQLPDVKLFYVSYEIPFFYYCFFPELIAFKLYIWGQTIWEFDYLKDRPFDFTVATHPDLERAKSILQSFLSIDSSELWSVNIVDNTLNQIEYFANTGNFKNPEDALVLCDKMTELVAHWRNMSKHGFKFPIDVGPEAPKGTFNLFQHEMLITSNTILVTSPKTNILFNIVNNPNYLQTSDSRMCAYQKEWFQKAISKSTPISKHNEKSRALFFNILNKKIEATKRRVEALL